MKIKKAAVSKVKINNRKGRKEFAQISQRFKFQGFDFAYFGASRRHSLSFGFAVIGRFAPSFIVIRLRRHWALRAVIGFASFGC
jgi:hypothetical protein